MTFKQYKSKENAIQSLKSDHFSCQFEFEDGKLFCKDNNKYYSAQDLYLVEYHRFIESDQIVMIYAILANDGIQGLIEYSFGPKINMEMISFLDKVKIVTEELV